MILKKRIFVSDIDPTLIIDLYEVIAFQGVNAILTSGYSICISDQEIGAVRAAFIDLISSEEQTQN